MNNYAKTMNNYAKTVVFSCYIQGKLTHEPGRSDPERDIVLGEEYAAVTRVSRPHARLTRRADAWLIEDGGSTGGTFVNGTPLDRGKRRELHDGDLIELAKGAPGATLVFVVPGGVPPSDAA